jgi:hypothetical protein
MLWSESMRWKRCAWHVEVLVPLYFIIWRNLFFPGKYPSRQKTMCGAYVVMIHWVPRGHINLVPVAIHSTWVAYHKVHYISWDVQSVKPRCLKDSINSLAFWVKFQLDMRLINRTSLLCKSRTTSQTLGGKIELRIFHWKYQY